jgi:hypothetical protein
MEDNLSFPDTICSPYKGADDILSSITGDIPVEYYYLFRLKKAMKEGSSLAHRSIRELHEGQFPPILTLCTPASLCTLPVQRFAYAIVVTNSI